MTGRERAVLVHIHDTIASTGVCPSQREIAGHFGVSDVTICKRIKRLLADGYIRRDDARPYRGLVVVRLPGGGLGADEIAWCHAHADRVRAMMQVADGFAVAA